MLQGSATATATAGWFLPGHCCSCHDIAVHVLQALTSSCLPAVSSALAGMLKVDSVSKLWAAACSKAARLVLVGVKRCCTGISA